MKKLTIILIFIVLFSLHSNIIYAADTTVATNVSDALDAQDALWGPYWTDINNGVVVYEDAQLDISYATTTDGGITWTPIQIQIGSTREIAVFYDQEVPEDTGTNLHVVWVDSGKDNLQYMTIDVSDGSLGTITEVIPVDVNGANGTNHVAITKTVGGNLITAWSTQTEIGAIKTSNAFVSTTTISNVFETTTEQDWVMMFPTNTADDNDAGSIFWDRSVNELSIKMYDDSLDSWTETSIDVDAVDGAHMNFDISVRHSDSNILLAYHSNDDDAGDDFRTVEIVPDSIGSPATTSKANIFTNQNESAIAGMIINQQTNDVYVSYAKGGTWTGLVDIVYHKSDDGMTTWGAEQAYSELVADDNKAVSGTRTIGNNGGRIQWSWHNDDLTEIFVNLTNDIEIVAAEGGAAAKVIRLSGVRLSGIRLY